ncbi:site-specific DNA-methyltransferase [Salmonella enterica subsp. enterica serovar Indiana]|nr:site-specific DNA-methyltransferase [Salmonella enterica subsp. enterica serovar Indiana]
MKDIPDQSVDLILCDLPYGTTQNKWDAVIPFDELWPAYSRICRGPVVLTAAQPFTSALIMSNVENFKYTWYWRKNRATNVLNAKKQPLRDTEDVCVFYAKKYNPQGLVEINKKSRNSSKDYDNYGSGTCKQYVQQYGNYPKQTLEIDSVQRTIHPTQKPVALMEYLIKTYTNEGDTVLDNCMGSGTTGVACVNTRRNFIGMEQEFKYFRIARQRIKEAGGEL